MQERKRKLKFLSFSYNVYGVIFVCFSIKTTFKKNIFRTLKTLLINDLMYQSSFLNIRKLEKHL